MSLAGVVGLYQSLSRLKCNERMNGMTAFAKMKKLLGSAWVIKKLFYVPGDIPLLDLIPYLSNTVLMSETTGIGVSLFHTFAR